MKLKIHNIPYYLTILAVFIQLITHLISFSFITYFHIVTFTITLFFLMPLNRYPSYYIFFIVIWLLIILLHAVFKNNIVVFGFMQSFFYGICFYAIFKYKTDKIEPRELMNNMYKIYGILLITLVAELILNMLGMETLMLDLFSNKNLGTPYKVLSAKIAKLITGYDLNSLNSIFFGPQSAATLVLICLLFYNPFDKLKPVKKQINFLAALGLYLVCYTMTSNLILIVLLAHFIFFSNHSSLNRPQYKLSIIIILVFGFSVLFGTLFYGFQASEGRDIYLFKWNRSVLDMLDLGTKEFLFGIPTGTSIEKYTVSWEFGLIQVVFMSGIMPAIFLVSLGIFLVVHLVKYNRSSLLQVSLTYRYLYQSARLSVFVFSICILSLIHYASIFSTGFFQLIGFHIAISFYCFDEMNYRVASYEKKLAHSF